MRRLEWPRRRENGTVAQGDLVSVWLWERWGGAVQEARGGDRGPCMDRKQATSAGFRRVGTAGAVFQLKGAWGLGRRAGEQEGVPGKLARTIPVWTDQQHPH